MSRQKSFFKHGFVNLEKSILRSINVHKSGNYVSLLSFCRYKELSHVVIKGQRLPYLSSSLVLIRADITSIFWILFFLFLGTWSYSSWLCSLRSSCRMLFLAPKWYSNVSLSKLFIQLALISQYTLYDAPQCVLAASQMLFDRFRYNFKHYC